MLKPVAKPEVALERRRQAIEPGARARISHEKIPDTADTVNISFGENNLCDIPPRIAIKMIGTSSMISSYKTC